MTTLNTQGLLDVSNMLGMGTHFPFERIRFVSKPLQMPEEDGWNVIFFKPRALYFIATFGCFGISDYTPPHCVPLCRFVSRHILRLEVGYFSVSKKKYPSNADISLPVSQFSTTWCSFGYFKDVID